MPKLSYGIPTNKSAPNVRFGLEKGFFADEGIDLSIHLNYGGPQLARSFETNEVAIGEFGAPPALTAIAHGLPVKVIGSGLRRKFMMYLGVRCEVRDFSELRGKRLGLLTRGSCNDWLARQMWLQAGLNPDWDLNLVEVEGGYPRLLSQLAEKRFEAILTIEPDLSAGECQGLLRVWAAAYEEAYLPRYQWVVMVARNDLIEREMGLVRAVLHAAARSSLYMVEHPDEWARFLERSHGITAEAAAWAVARELPHVARDCIVDLDGLDEAIGLQRRLGAFDHAFRSEEITDLRGLPMDEVTSEKAEQTDV